MLSGLKRRIESQNFQGGKATSILGGIELDFTRARLAEGRAAIELTAILGGIEVRVPQTWRVEVEGRPLLGGIEDKHTFAPGTETAQTLHLKASAILGGIEIKE
jgi:predicted membrane protein